MCLNIYVNLKLSMLIHCPLFPKVGTLSRLGAALTTAHEKEIKSVAVSKDGRFLVSGSCDHTIRVWNLEVERLMHTLKGHSDEVSVCF